MVVKDFLNQSFYSNHGVRQCIAYAGVARPKGHGELNFSTFSRVLFIHYSMTALSFTKG